MAAIAANPAQMRPRMPKLTYRSAPAAIGSPNSDVKPVERVPPNLPDPIITTFPAEETLVTNPVRSPISKELLQRPTPAPAKPAPAPKTKQKKSFLGLKALVSTREPSALAFAQLEEQARRQAAQQKKDAKLQQTQFNLSGVSTAKLPETVPPVNSKWDGVPTSLKEMEKQAKKMGSSQNLGHRRSRSGSRGSGRRSQSRPSTSRPGNHSSSTSSSSTAINKRYSAFSVSSGSRSHSDTYVNRDSSTSYTLSTLDSPSAPCPPETGAGVDSAPFPIPPNRPGAGETRQPPAAPAVKPETVPVRGRPVTPQKPRTYPLDLRRNNSLTSLADLVSPESSKINESSRIGDSSKTNESTNKEINPTISLKKKPSIRPPSGGKRDPGKISVSTTTQVPEVKVTGSTSPVYNGPRRVTMRPPKAQVDKVVAPWEEPESVFGVQCEAPVIKRTPSPCPPPILKPERNKASRRSRLAFFR